MIIVDIDSKFDGWRSEKSWSDFG